MTTSIAGNGSASTNLSGQGASLLSLGGAAGQASVGNPMQALRTDFKEVLSQAITAGFTQTPSPLPSVGGNQRKAAFMQKPSPPPPKQIPNPEVLMLELRKLMAEYNEIMVEVSDFSIDKLIDSKNERAQLFLKKTIELAKKFLDAMSSWANKLPSFLTGVATMVVLAGLMCAAIAAMPASGGLSGALVMACVLAMASAYTGIQTCGQFANDVKNPNDPKPFGFAAAQENGDLPKGVGDLLDAFFSADPAGMAAAFAKIGGIVDEEQLMIISGVCTALAMAISIGCLLKCASGSAAVKLDKLARYAQMVSAGASTASGVTGIASTATQDSENANRIAAVKAQNQQIEARFAMEQVLRVLLEALKSSTNLPETDQAVSEKVVKALESVFRTSSKLVSLTA